MLRTERGRAIAGLLRGETEFVAPELVDVEVLSTLGREVLRGALSPERGLQALTRLGQWRLRRLSHRRLLRRAFELRRNYTAYDALYVAVGQLFDATVVTCDGALARAPAPRGVRVWNICQGL